MNDDAFMRGLHSLRTEIENFIRKPSRPRAGITIESNYVVPLLCKLIVMYFLTRASGFSKVIQFGAVQCKLNL